MAKSKIPKAVTQQLNLDDNLSDSETTPPNIEEIVVSEARRASAKAHVLSVGDGVIGRTIDHMIRSRFRIIYIRSHDERRLLKFFKELSYCNGFDVFHWDVDRGLLEIHTQSKVITDEAEANTDPTALLSYINEHAYKHQNVYSKILGNNKIIQQQKVLKPKETIYLLLDFHVFMDGAPVIERKLKEFTGITSSCTIVIISPTFICPATLEKEVNLVDFPVPSHKELNTLLNNMAKGMVQKIPTLISQMKETGEEEIVKAASGLTLSEAENAYAMSITAEQKFDIPRILQEKKQIIQKSGILEYCEPQFTFDDVGGLDNLKNWLRVRKIAFTDDARNFGIDFLRGILMCGTPGCGKSLICKALASFYEMPLLRLDVGSIFSKHLGDSELRIRTCLKTAESLAPCVLFIDEVEKGISGASGSGETDGGVSSRVFATLLTWMSDKTAAVFVVCTANNILSIPPEFIRAGRFDEIFFVDLPNDEQRYDITEKLIKRKKRDPNKFDIEAIVSASKNYTPVEIEKAIGNALFVAYADGLRELRTSDIVQEIKRFFPLYNSRKEEIEAMREWALGKDKKGGRAILANSISAPINKNTSFERDINIEVNSELLV